MANKFDSDGDDMITITRIEYNRLVDNDTWLDCLEAAGVDTWEGYEDALLIKEQYGE